MKRTDVTYGQLDKALRSLGFSCRLAKGEPPARVYEHQQSGAYISMPPFPESEFVIDYHLVGARTTADLFGIADAKVFDAKLQKAGRNGRRRQRTNPDPWRFGEGTSCSAPSQLIPPAVATSSPRTPDSTTRQSRGKK